MQFNYLSLFFESSLIVQIIIILLIFSSMYSWMIIIEKFFLISREKKQLLNFENFYVRNRSSNETILRNLFNQSENFEKLTTYQSFKRAKDFLLENNQNLSIKQIEQIMVQNFYMKMHKMESKLDNLGIIASVSPYISLLGTTFGIIRTFAAIGTSKSVNLIQIGPGIAEVLFTTAIGLMVAIPASIFYNRYTSQIDYIYNFSENFFYDVSDIIHNYLFEKK